jgi:hypothetical protein
MTQDDRNFKIFGALLAAGAGIWLEIEGFVYGGLWRIVLGAAFVVFGIARATYLWQKERKS